eukprot:g11198.t1
MMASAASCRQGRATAAVSRAPLLGLLSSFLLAPSSAFVLSGARCSSSSSSSSMLFSTALRHGGFAHRATLGSGSSGRSALRSLPSPFLRARTAPPSAEAMSAGASRGRRGTTTASVAPEAAAAASAAVGSKLYDHKQIEARWQQHWEENGIFKTPERAEGRPKKFVLDMFPYPSGSGLHVGHPEGYTASDVMARYWRMKGFDVLHPMGWDSFGLPAEQHAILTGTHPKVTTYTNIDTFRRQLKMLGFSYDWDRELATTDAEYVKWTQWIFLELFKAGLAEQSEARVNWCPALGTVLANEEIIDGKSERGDHPVVRMPLRQWTLKITKYADQLEAGLEGLEWPEGTLTAQKQWIGRSEGASITFDLEGTGETVEVFTTRPDTLMGVTYLVLAPEHPLTLKLATDERRAAVEEYATASASRSDLDRTSVGKGKKKTGTDTGAVAVHPLSGEKVPVWTADYVLGSYGTGAVMAVPAHDERDLAFAQTFNLPVRRVVKPVESKGKGKGKGKGKEQKGQKGGEEAPAAVKEDIVEEDVVVEEAFTGKGVAVNSGEGLDGLSTDECSEAVVRQLEAKGHGRKEINYRLRDWIFSRQRYWGEPIPIYFPVEMVDPDGDPRKGDDHKICYDQPMPVDVSELPLNLPEMDSFEPGDDPQGCLTRVPDWRFFQRDGKWFARETNTMPQWAGSCWYYLRFTDNKNTEAGWSKKADRDWMPVDLYVGGQEHAVLHLLYARFWYKVLHDLGHVKDAEPFQRLVHQGMILGMDGEKMSKSRGNVINPDDIVDTYGADALRLYEMFMGPLEATKPWQTEQVAGVTRFRDRVYQLARRGADDETELSPETLTILHKTMKKVSEDIDELAFNTAISSLMVLTNHLMTFEKPPREALEALVVMVSPFAPHLGEECWDLLGNNKGDGLAFAPWIQWKEELCVSDTVTLGVQVNGKVRAELELSKTATSDDARALAEVLPQVVKFTEGKDVKKFIYVPGRIISFVVK